MTKKQLDIMKTWLMEVLDEAWATAAREERQKVVAWLRNEAFLSMYEVKPDDVADAIERGDHVKEVDSE